MRKEILMEVNPYQTSVVLLEDGEIVEIYIERFGSEKLVGNIYKGRVQNVLPGMQAAFVDIGIDKNAFLYAGDILADKSDFEFQGMRQGVEFEKDLKKQPQNIKDIIKPGQDIMVQVLKEPGGTKGCRVTTHITLPGRTLVLMPTVSYVGVSRRISDETERNRLRTILEEIKPDNMGVIVRTAAEGKSHEEFKKDIDFLVRIWERIKQREAMFSGPRLIHADEQLMFRVIRDMLTPEIDYIAINDNDTFEKLGLIADVISPQLKYKIKLYQGDDDMFKKLNLHAKVLKCLERKVWLDNGAYIVIDHTEALTSIDVNTGKYVGCNSLQQTIVDTNCAAAKEVAKQIRLRDISGIIIIDFIDMDDPNDKEKVLATLKKELEKDHTKTNVLGITALGLVEMTRKKMRNDLSTALQATCHYCNGYGRVFSNETTSMRIRRQLINILRKHEYVDYMITAHPDVIAFIEKRMMRDIELQELARPNHVYMRAVETTYIEDYSIQPVSGKDMERMSGSIKNFI